MSKKILAALLAVLMVLTIVPMTAFAAGFDDTTGHWGQSSIDRWTQLGILNGKGNGKFDPNGSMTRAEFAQMLVNMMGYTEKAENVFNDVPAGSWYEDAMLKLVAAGVLNGTGAGKADPNGRITREQTAVLLCRAFGIKPSPDATLTFKDSASVSDWARDAVAALAERGMMNGIGNNTAAPKLDINRASVAQLADNMIAHYVTADTTITGKVDGIVLVAGGATVTISDATVEAPVVVAPKAEEATVALAGETTVESVAVAAENAAVTVADTATVGAVSVEAPSATAEIAGKVETITVAEAAESAAVTVAETAEVGAVSVEAPSATAEIAGNAGTVTVAESAESAAVTVAETAEVGTVSVEAPKATTEIAGKADSVTVAGTADSAKVNVPGTVGTVKTEAANTDVKVDGEAGSVTVAGENAKVDVAGTVGTVSTDAANTNVTVSGKVEKVDVAQGASDTTIATESGAKVDSVVTNGGNTTVSGSGTVSNVTAGENATGTTVTTGGTKVENNSGESVSTGKGEIASGENGTTPSTGGSTGGSGGGSTTPTPAPVDVVAAPSVDQGKAPSGGGDKVVISGVGTTTVTATRTSEANTYNVVVHGTDIMNHTNAQNADGHWVGFGMPVAPDGKTYSYYVDDSATATGSIADRTYTAENGKTYNTVYFAEDANETEAQFNEETHTITVKDGDTIVATYNVSFAVTWWKATGVQVLATASETAAVITKLEESMKVPWAHKFAAGLGFTATKDGLTIKLNGETTTGKLESTSSGEANADGYLTYVLQVTDDSIIKGINLGESAAALDELDMEGITLVMNKRIYDGTNKSFFPTTSTTYQLVDAAGRVQDEVVVTVDTTGCTIEGMKKVTFVKEDGTTVVQTIMVADNGNINPLPTVPTKEGYTGGKWVDNGTDTEFTTDTTVTADMTVKASGYTLTTYNITYTLNDGTNDSGNPATYTIETETITLQSATRDGFTFLGWFNDKNEQVKTIAKGSTGNLTLAAKWASTTEVTAMTADVYKLYTQADGFKDGIPTQAAFGSPVFATDTTDSTKINVTGSLNAITDPAYSGFNSAYATEQTGYYLLFQFEAPAAAKQASGNIVTTTSKTFTAANLDEVDSKQIFSFIWWVDSPKDTDTKATKNITFTVDWDGDGTAEGTDYTLDLSSLTLKAKIPTETGSQE